MLGETTAVKSQSIDGIKSVIMQERASAVEALRGIENSANRLLGSGQDMISHPIQSLSTIVEPKRFVSPHPWRSIALAAGSGLALGYLLQKGRSPRSHRAFRVQARALRPPASPALQGDVAGRSYTSELGSILVRELNSLARVAIQEFSERFRSYLQQRGNWPR